MKKDVVFDDINILVEYIINKYFLKYKESISTIKLQKTLFFLFAFWGAYVEKMTQNFISYDEKTIQQHFPTDKNLNIIFLENENIFNKYPKYLFKDKFQAWTYGPTIPNIWFDEKTHKKIVEQSNIIPKLPIDNFVKGFIDDQLNSIFEAPDFALIEKSHESNSWKENYEKFKKTKHPQNIPFDKIIEDYVNEINY